ncbi:MAG: hypothetical protein EPN23_08345 [Verrucomicrobia bacterium]|nr:MAG: hypothetical protein EPN23_08345 [Verrucomicrobiota bacterium]
MKLLSLLQGGKVEDQIGYHRACEQLCSEGFLETYRAIPFLGRHTSAAWATLCRETLSTAAEIQADAVFFQFFHDHRMPCPDDLVAALRALPAKPALFTSAGDSFGLFTRSFPSAFRSVSRAADVTFLTGMGYMADSLVNSGSRNIVLMPNGFCQTRFAAGVPVNQPEFDVVFVGSNSKARNPFSYIRRLQRERYRQITLLQLHYGSRFALYGRGWEGFKSWQGPIPYAEQQTKSQQGRVIVGGYPGGLMDYYTSDRVLIAIASGVPFVDYWTPRVDTLFRQGEHWHLYRNEQEMLATIDRLLAMTDQDRRQLGVVTAEYAGRKHQQYHRMKNMLAIVRDQRAARHRGVHPALPGLEYFLPEVDVTAEMSFAVRAWNG